MYICPLGYIRCCFMPLTSWCSLPLQIQWAASSENVSSSMRKMSGFTSSCACTKYHPGSSSQFIHSVGSNDSVSGQWQPWSDCTDAQADLGFCSAHMTEGTFSHDAVQLNAYLVTEVLIKYVFSNCSVTLTITFAIASFSEEAFQWQSQLKWQVSVTHSNDNHS